MERSSAKSDIARSLTWSLVKPEPTSELVLEDGIQFFAVYAVLEPSSH
jgi:hypothetical protein